MTRSESFISLYEMDMPTIRVKNVSDHHISIYLSDGSCAELSEDVGDVWKDTLREHFGIDVKGTLFWFNRLKTGAFGEGKGSGTLLMTELIKILDEKDITVLNQVNPYGLMKMTQLKSFYKKFGFIDIGHDGMIRYPKK